MLNLTISLFVAQGLVLADVSSLVFSFFKHSKWEATLSSLQLNNGLKIKCNSLLMF